MSNKKSKSLVFSLLFSTLFYQADVQSQTEHPFYIGLIGGYGSTTWEGLVATEKNQNVALMLSTPIEVEEGGATWGILAGYEFSPHLALEANYMRYPDSTVYFNPVSLFSFTYEGLLNLTTQTDSISLMAKFMVSIPNTDFRVYSSAGAASLYRKDMIIDDWRVSPTFGLGVNYNFNEHVMGEIAANYTAGFGESLLSPVDSYFPFLYSVTMHLAYRF